MDNSKCLFAEPLKKIGSGLTLSSGLGIFLYCCRPRVDLVPSMALDTHSIFRLTWSCDAHEATQLRFL